MNINDKTILVHKGMTYIYDCEELFQRSASEGYPIRYMMFASFAYDNEGVILKDRLIGQEVVNKILKKFKITPLQFLELPYNMKVNLAKLFD